MKIMNKCIFKVYVYSLFQSLSTYSEISLFEDLKKAQHILCYNQLNITQLNVFPGWLDRRDSNCQILMS